MYLHTLHTCSSDLARLLQNLLRASVFHEYTTVGTFDLRLEPRRDAFFLAKNRATLLKHYLSCRHLRFFACRDYEFLELDSELFGLATGRDTAKTLNPDRLQNTLETARSDGICLLYLSVRCEDPFRDSIVVNAQLTGDHVEGKVLYSVELSKSLVSALRHCCSSRVIIEEFLEPVATPRLIELSLSAGENSRFKRDKNINVERFEASYKAWIQNSVTKQAADIVFVARTEEMPINEVAGMITLRKNDLNIQVSLMAVSSQYRRSGISKTIKIQK